jgi:hypothetical protein
VVKRFAELTQEEVADLWGLAQLVGKTLEPHYQAASLTLAIQVRSSSGVAHCAQSCRVHSCRAIPSLSSLDTRDSSARLRSSSVLAAASVRASSCLHPC